MITWFASIELVFVQMPRLLITRFITSPMYSVGIMMWQSMIGSSIRSMPEGSGMKTGLST